MTQRQYRRRFNKHRAYDLELLTAYRRVWRKIELNARYGKLGSNYERPGWKIRSSVMVPFNGFITTK